MQQLIVRWYQFGAFSPVFRTHGCRSEPSEPNTKQCSPSQGSCGFNEIWSYGHATPLMLQKTVRLRSEVIKPYIQELARNVTSHGVPTMRPLAYEFPADPKCWGLNDQYMLGPNLSTWLRRSPSRTPRREHSTSRRGRTGLICLGRTLRS